MTANRNAAPGWSPDTAQWVTTSPRDHTNDATAQFLAAMRNAGIEMESRIIADGKLHRVHVEGDKRGTVNGWYVLHMDKLPAGVFGHWKSGVCSTWRADLGRSLTRTERAEHRARMDAARALRDADQARERAGCRERAASLWRDAGEAAAGHGYLSRKGIAAHGTREHAGCLIVPVLDAAGTLHGLQFIGPDCGKKFLTGTAKYGRFCPLGRPPAADAILAIAEGFATAASVHEATGWPVAAAFDAGNLRAVALALRKLYPCVRIVIAADNDHGTPGNPGLTKGRDAAQAVGGLVIAPALAAGDAGTDWNDYATRYGEAATAAALLDAASEVRHVA